MKERDKAIKLGLQKLDNNLNYIIENDMLSKYAEIDDMIPLITLNPYLDEKQLNGADELWEYCSYNIEERNEEFIEKIKKHTNC